jgi:hypothetical protein
MIRPPKRCGVDRSRLHVQLLSGRQRGHRLFDILPAHLQVITGQWYRTIGFGQAFQAAHATSRRPYKTTAPRRQRIGPLARQPHSQHNSVGDTDYGQFAYFSRFCNNSLGVAEAEGEILEIAWCRH